MNWLTIAVILILALFVVIGHKKGVLKTVYSVVTGVIVLIVVIFANPFMTDILETYTQIDDRIEQKCHEQLKAGVKNAAGKESEKLDKEQQIDVLGLKLPEVVVEQFLQADDYADDLLEESGIYTGISGQVTELAMKGISYAVTMIILVIVFGALYRVFRIIEKLPVIGEVNRGLGAILGLGEGLLLVWIFFALVAMGSTSDFCHMIIERVYESQFLVMIYENNLVLTMLM